MKINKIAISLLLLFTYTFGFAHSVIPHLEGGHTNLHSSNNKITIQSHVHHQHTPDEIKDSNHEHLSHNNHFDTNITDYVLCVLKTMEHKDANCNVQQYIPFKRSDKNLGNLNKTALTALLHIIFTGIELPIKSITQYSNNVLLFKTPPLLNSPNRGPPTATC